MADKYRIVPVDGGAVKQLMVDNGDGSYSDAVNVVGAAGGVSITVTSGDLAVLGNVGDAPATDDTGAATAVALLKRLSAAQRRFAVASVTHARPADTVAYAAGDVVGGALHLAALGVAGGHAKVTGADVRLDVAAVPVGMAGFRIHMYGVTPPSALADNAAWTLGAGDRGSYLGFVDVGAPEDVGATLYAQITCDRTVALTETGLYVYVVTLGAYAPTASDSMTLRLTAEVA